MTDDQRPRTVKDLIKRKKDLIKRRTPDLSLDEKIAITSQIEKIDSIIWSRVSKSDQNFFRTFFKIAKETLEPDVFTRLEGVASTRQHFHESSSKNSYS
ncbi:hypothetical protein [Acinetobacter variabilis]|uniref:Uncharacterized protein n=1 Tax=Acinetobacter variabilis TaxID=70346 RepID=N8WVS5_9GAMM|nr:hypothetical protein [Acinetobacter variabilis]ENV00974.1 hypothetical protein F969_00060 [Acinetobacter variabilis]